MVSDIEKSVSRVASAWKESPYYENAEKWTHLFWGDGSVFKSYFEVMDLTRVVELACGHGRHAEVVAPMASSMVLMDVHEGNLEACRTRLSSDANVECLKGNGYDYSPLPDESVTAIYCYDAMVHFAPDVVASYLRDTMRVLKPGGMALYHHSNHHVDDDDGNYGKNPHARNSMTLARFKSLAEGAGLSVIRATSLAWGGIADLDGLSLISKQA